MTFDRAMSAPIDVNREAMEDLPQELQEPLRRFMATRDENDLSDLIRAALSDFSDQELPEELSGDTNFIQDLGLDSLAITEFVFFFEDVFNLKINNDELASLSTLEELKQFLLRKLAA